MASDSRRQSLRAVVAVVATAAILVSLRSIYQEMRHREERAQAEALAQARPPGWEKEVERARATVRGQLEAFRKGNWEKAFTFAAGSFHEQMKLDDFRQMVEGGYPQIAHPKETRLGPGEWSGGGVVVEVTVTDRDGGTGQYLYMLGQENGDWKVVGVQGAPGDAPPAGAPGPTEAPAPVPGPSGAA